MKAQSITQTEASFSLKVAAHFGMCFGVKAAIKTAQAIAERSPVTILGELAHNATVKHNLEKRGAQHSSLSHINAPTKNVVITAHGASDKDRERWRNQGHRVTDTTCPLVHRAHAALRNLVESGYTPIVIGKPNHVEVRGLIGDFPQVKTILTAEDIQHLDLDSPEKIGVISQTTQQIDHVEILIKLLKKKFPATPVRFVDTICRPTKDRQKALVDLCKQVQLVIVVGGKNSNNTAQLAMKCRVLGCIAYHVQRPQDIDSAWFRGIDRVGLTAGTSTPDEDIVRVKKHLQALAFSI